MNTWATTIISGLVLIVAFMQWRTAHQKVMLDLFDRRMSVFNKAQDFHRRIAREGVRQEAIDVSRFHEVRNEAYFLFGQDIIELLGTFHVAIINMSTQAALAADPDDEDRAAYVANSYKYLKEALAVANQFDGAFSSYMRMDQKRVRTPAEWLRDRDRIRHSYADEKQR